MKFVPNAVTIKLGRQALVLQKHSPTILFGVGVVGFVATAVLASKATLGVNAVLNEHERMSSKMDFAFKNEDIPDYNDVAYQKDKVILFSQTAGNIVKLYGPTLIVGTISIAALTQSHNILTQRNLALTAAYAAVDKAFKEYRARVRQHYGDEVDSKLRYSSEEFDVISETAKGEPVVSKELRVAQENGNSMYAKFFDECSRNWTRNSEYNLMFIRSQQAWANDLLKARGHVFLNEVYDSLDIERTKAGAVVGWLMDGDGDNFVDFGLYNHDSERARAFVNGSEYSILLDFNVDGVIYDKI